MKLLDNGGRFYHLLCHAGDGRITHGELAAASGNSPEKMGAYIYLAMKTLLLEPTERESVFEALSPKLRENLERCWPRILSASEVEAEGKLHEPLIVGGYAYGVEQRGLVVGDMPWPRPDLSRYNNHEPVTSLYRVYLLSNEIASSRSSAAVAVSLRSQRFEDGKRVLIGGWLDEMMHPVNGERSHRFLLRAKYCLDASILPN